MTVADRSSRTTLARSAGTATRFSCSFNFFFFFCVIATDDNPDFFEEVGKTLANVGDCACLHADVLVSSRYSSDFLQQLRRNGTNLQAGFPEMRKDDTGATPSRSLLPSTGC
jgi:hypothetical protein